MNNCLLCGVGGQGTVLASKLIAFAAMQRGENVRTAETIGMAQRGGCVVSHVRTGKEIYSPLISKGEADIVIAFEPAEAVRCLPYLKEGGTIIVNRKAVMPVTASLKGGYEGEQMLFYLQKNVPQLTVLDGDEICRQCGSPKVLNIALLAAAAKSGALSMDLPALKDAVVKMVNPKFHSLNLKAIELIEQG